MRVLSNCSSLVEDLLEKQTFTTVGYPLDSLANTSNIHRKDNFHFRLDIMLFVRFVVNMSMKRC